MKKLYLILFLFLSFVHTLEAAKDSTEIKIDATFVDYVNFIGTAAGTSRFFTVDAIKPVGNASSGARLSLGTLGIESSSSGDCDIEFSAQNNFRLRHTETNERLTAFRLLWEGDGFSGNPVRSNQLTLACNTIPSVINFQAVAAFNQNPQAGVYQDIVTITVTTQ